MYYSLCCATFVFGVCYVLYHLIHTSYQLCGQFSGYVYCLNCVIVCMSIVAWFVTGMYVHDLVVVITTVYSNVTYFNCFNF